MDWLFDSGIWLTILAIVDNAIRIAAVIFVPRNRKPTAGMAWLLAIFLLPIPGVLLYVLIGNPKLPRKRRAVQAGINAVLKDAESQLPSTSLRPDAPPWFTSLTVMNRNLGALRILGDNDAHLVRDYQASLDEMAEAIRSAKEYVHVEFYILKSDDSTENFFRAMEEVRARGVEVRVLMDHWANLSRPRHRLTRDRLSRMGADWHYLLPLQPLQNRWQRPDLRNHRKLLVIDNNVAYIGSQNLIERSYGLARNRRKGLQWADLMVRVHGPVVSSINAVFISDYYSETGSVPPGVELHENEKSTGDLDCQIVPSGPGFELENNLQMFLQLLYAAQDRVIMISPYFVPDEALMRAVAAAVSRGVRVELFASELSDQALVYHAQRSYYEALLRAGVKIYLYPAPYILHTKALSIDDEVAVIGSSNMDMRSFGLNFEISMLVRGKEFVDELRRLEDDYRSRSTELDLDEWLRRPFWGQTLDNIARLTSALQ